MKLESLLTLLEKWPIWQRIKEAPKRLDALERRMAKLEGKGKGKGKGEREGVEVPQQPVEVCPSCGDNEYRLVQSPGAGASVWRCDMCGFEQRTVE